MNRASSNIDYGVGIRVLSGDQSGYAYVENVTLQDMLTAARTAARIANVKGNKAAVNLTEKPIVQNYYAVKTPGVKLP